MFKKRKLSQREDPTVSETLQSKPAKKKNLLHDAQQIEEERVTGMFRNKRLKTENTIFVCNQSLSKASKLSKKPKLLSANSHRASS